MIRKWTALFLSLVLAMMLPLTALADWQHTISVEPGDMLASEAALEDLLDVLALRFTKNDESGALTVLLNQKEIVTLGLTADQSGVYVESDLVGEDVLYISWEDGFAFLNKILASSVAETGLDEEALQELESGLSEMKNGIISTIEADNSSQSKFLPAKLEESMRAAEELFPNDPVMTEYVKGLYENIVFEEGKFADDWRDTADQKCRIAMDAADLTALCDTDYLKMMIKEAISAEATDATEEEINEATEMVIAEVRKLFEESGFEMIMEIYTLDQGNTLVGLDVNMNMTLKDEAQPYAIQMTAEYDRLKNDKGTSYNASGMFAVNEEKAEFSFELLQNKKGVSEGMLGLLAAGEELVITYDAKPHSDERVRQYALYLRSNASSILEPAASDRPVITFHVTTVKAPAKTLAALENATPENSLNVLQIAEAELMTLGEQIVANVTQALYAALAELPTSTLELLTNGGIL